MNRSGMLLTLAITSLIGSSTPPALDLSPAKVQNLGDLPIFFQWDKETLQAIGCMQYLCSLTAECHSSARSKRVAPAFCSRRDSVCCRRCSKLCSDVTLQDLLCMVSLQSLPS